MILRRVIQHLKAQSWTAVVLDLAIVVMGVFAGIQASNWNDARSDRKLAQHYVQDIRADITADLDEYAALQKDTAQRRSASEAVLRAIKNGLYEEPGLFLRQVDEAGRFSPPVLHRATYDDLVATGGFRLIDRNVRENLSEYYGYAEQTDSGFELQRRRVFDGYLPLAVAALPLESQRWIYSVRSEDLKPIPGSDRDPKEADQTLARLAADDRADNALKAVIRGTWSIDRQLSNMRARARLILAKLNKAQRGAAE